MTSENDLKILARIKAHPYLRERIEAILDIAENTSGELITADQAEGKANASKWSNELPGMPCRFEWQKGYGAFTVSYSQIDPVRHYIRNQHEHHRIKTFEEEYITLLNRHNIKFDHQYLFEAEHCG